MVGASPWEKWDLWWLVGTTFLVSGSREAKLLGLYTENSLPQILENLDLDWSITTWLNVGSGHVSFFHE